MKFAHEDARLKKEDLTVLASPAAVYLSYLQKISTTPGYGAPESFINLPADRDIAGEVERVVREKTAGGLKTLILVGIGGSSLGAEAAYQALRQVSGKNLAAWPADLVVADTIDPLALAALTSWLKATTFTAEELLLVVVSKSGTTTETVANAEVVWQALAARFSRAKALARTVVVTDYRSKLWDKAEEAGIQTVAIPGKVGGRFSVFSAAGLVPLAAVGLPTTELLAGAQALTPLCLNPDIESNPALLSAAVLAGNWRQGKNIHDTFFFSKELEGVGKWYRQLLAESIGKEKDLDNNEVRSGITPTVSIGSTDLHSQAQLTLGGPKDKVTTFVTIDNYPEDPTLAGESLFASLLPDLKTKSLDSILKAIYGGVKESYREADLPFMEISLAELSARELGALLQFKMFEIIYLAYLLRVNAFDQPAVEAYKEATRKLLLNT